MKLKTLTVEDRERARRYLRGLSLPHSGIESLPSEDSEEARFASIESISRQLPTLESLDRESTAGDTAHSSAARASLRSPRLIGERAHRFHFLDTRCVDYLQVDGNYVTIHIGEDKYLTRSTLKHLSDVLAPFDFIRIDRSVLVNLRQVEYVERLESGQFAFQLHRGRQLVSSRERSSAIVRLLRRGVR